MQLLPAQGLLWNVKCHLQAIRASGQVWWQGEGISPGQGTDGLFPNTAVVGGPQRGAWPKEQDPPNTLKQALPNYVPPPLPPHASPVAPSGQRAPGQERRE